MVHEVQKTKLTIQFIFDNTAEDVGLIKEGWDYSDNLCLRS